MSATSPHRVQQDERGRLAVCRTWPLAFRSRSKAPPSGHPKPSTRRAGFPHQPAVQRLILEERSPMSGQDAVQAVPGRTPRPDWDRIRVRAVCAGACGSSFAQNFTGIRFGFGELLAFSRRVTGRSSRSRGKDSFWGRAPEGGRFARRSQRARGDFSWRSGEELRAEPSSLVTVGPPDVPDFLLSRAVGSPRSRLTLTCPSDRSRFSRNVGASATRSQACSQAESPSARAEGASSGREDYGGEFDGHTTLEDIGRS